MSPKKITDKDKRLILKEKRNNPYLGVRALSTKIKDKYNIEISKSTIHKIFKKQGIKSKPGRKETSLLYQKRKVKECGFILLKALDSHLGIFKYLQDELNIYFPRLSKELLYKFIFLVSLSNLSGGNLRQNIEQSGFLRIAGLKRFPVKKFNYFKNKLTKYKPIADLEPVKEKLIFVSSIKFYFKNGSQGICDAKMATLWQDICDVDYFYLPLFGALSLFNQMLKNKLIIIGYVKSFDYLSALAFNFVKGVQSGVKRVEFLDQKGKIVYKTAIEQERLRFILGFNSKILAQGTEFLVKSKAVTCLNLADMGEYYLRDCFIKFLQPTDNQYIELNNVLIKKSKKLSAFWGILSLGEAKNVKLNWDKIVKSYFKFWPDINNAFENDLKVIQKSFLSQNKVFPLANILPSHLKLGNINAFSRLGQLVSVLFKEMLNGWEPKGKKGDFVETSQFIKVFIEKCPKKVKRKFNHCSFLIRGKRVVLF